MYSVKYRLMSSILPLFFTDFRTSSIFLNLRYFPNMKYVKALTRINQESTLVAICNMISHIDPMTFIPILYQIAIYVTEILMQLKLHDWNLVATNNPLVYLWTTFWYWSFERWSTIISDYKLVCVIKCHVFVRNYNAKKELPWGKSENSRLDNQQGRRGLVGGFKAQGHLVKKWIKVNQGLKANLLI